jgi:hypothetical protein
VIDLWDDTRIRLGANWKKEIECALDGAGFVVLLVSADFLASDFVANSELPRILEAASNRGTKVFPVVVGPCMFVENIELSRYQAINKPERPLSAMEESEAEATLVDLARAIRGHAYQPLPVPPGRILVKPDRAPRVEPPIPSNASPPPRPYHGSSPYLFVSYAACDRDTVLSDVACLQAEGFRISFDTAGFSDQRRIDAAEAVVERLMYGSTGVLVFVSEGTLGNRNILRDLEYTEQLGRPALVVALESLEGTGGNADVRAFKQALAPRSPLRRYDLLPERYIDELCTLLPADARMIPVPSEIVDAVELTVQVVDSFNADGCRYRSLQRHSAPHAFQQCRAALSYGQFLWLVRESTRKDADELVRTRQILLASEYAKTNRAQCEARLFAAHIAFGHGSYLVQEALLNCVRASPNRKLTLMVALGWLPSSTFRQISTDLVRHLSTFGEPEIIDPLCEFARATRHTETASAVLQALTRHHNERVFRLACDLLLTAPPYSGWLVAEAAKHLAAYPDRRDEVGESLTDAALVALGDRTDGKPIVAILTTLFKVDPERLFPFLVNNMHTFIDGDYHVASQVASVLLSIDLPALAVEMRESYVRLCTRAMAVKGLLAEYSVGIMRSRLAGLC